jgi:tetratricopeptide (TPR) repeat protein
MANISMGLLMIKKVFLLSVLFLPLLASCQRIEGKKTYAVPAAIDHSNKLDNAEGPDYDGLIGEYRAILSEDPNNFSALVAMGNAYFDSGQWKNAITMYEHALRLDPRNADVRTDMGTAYRNLNMPDRALAEYRIALEHEPAHLNARYNMGVVLAHDKKNYRAAIQIWEELLKQAPNFPNADAIRASIAALHRGVHQERAR